MNDTYSKGLIDGIRLWGEACGRQASCDTCQLGLLRGCDMTCQEFASKFPEKMLSLLKEMNSGVISYYDEYALRFPSSQLTVEELAICTCRRAIFEGYLDCDSGDDTGACVECWLKPYEARGVE